MAEYRVNLIYQLNSDMCDSKAEEIVGRKCSDSGAGFGERDMAWNYQTRKDAVAAWERLVKQTHCDCSIERFYG